MEAVSVGVEESDVASLGAKHFSRVAGTLNGQPFRSSLMKMGDRMFLGVHKANVDTLGLRFGDTVAVRPIDSTPSRAATTCSRRSSRGARAGSRRGGGVGEAGPVVTARLLDRSGTRRGRRPAAARTPRDRRARGSRPNSMSISAETITAPVEVDRPASDDVPEPDPPWVVIVWNDPMNLMSLRDLGVLQKLFGYPRAKAEKLMMDVHYEGQGGRVERDPREGRVRRVAPARSRTVGDDAEGRVTRGARRADQAHAAR